MSHHTRQPAGGATARRALAAAGLVAMLLLPGCSRQGKFSPVDMWNRSRLRPLEASPQFANGSSAQALVPGTVPRGPLRVDNALYTGRSGGVLVSQFPITVNDRVLRRGQERFNVYCSPCHSRLGDGKGMIVKRGFTQPPDYAIARLRGAPVGHFFDVMTNGYGAMYSYASRVSPEDRWAIAAYIRVLQRARPVVPTDQRTSSGAPYEGTVTRARS